MFSTALSLVTSTLSATVPTQVAHNQHLATVHTQRDIHNAALDRSLVQSHELADFELKLHDRTLRRAQRLHYETVSYELDISRRELCRDVWAQKNNLISTIMIINTVMVISIYSLLIQGYQFPNTTTLQLVRANNTDGGVSSSSLTSTLDEGHTVAFTSLCCLSVACHILSIFVAFKLNSRTIQFQMHNPKTRYRPCGKTHPDFDDFFKCHGAGIEKLAFYLFYLGTSLSLITSAVFIWNLDLGMWPMKMMFDNNSDHSGDVGLSLVNSIVAVIGVVASVVMYFKWKE